MNIFISAGDPSGDIHAANLAAALKRASPGTTVTALGGQKLREVCDEFLADIVGLGGFGFWQPVRLFFKLRALLKNTVLKNWERAKPDRVVVVDYYGFNIFVAAEAFKRGIPVYYYISPQVWATRPGRIRKIARYVRKMIVILPFEEKLYRDAGLDAEFVGHPLLDLVPVPETTGVSVTGKMTIGLFPGSRPNVFKRHIGLLIETANLIGKSLDAEFKIFCVPALAPLCKGLPYPVVVEENYEERKKISLAITTSGTVSLENALLCIPMVVYYKLSSFNYFIARMLVNIPYVTMVNILLGRMLVPELLQDEATPENIAGKVKDIFAREGSLEAFRKELAGLRAHLGRPGVSARAAEIILGNRT